MAVCQPTVTAILIFHVSDEVNLDRGSPGCSTPTTRQSIRRSCSARSDARGARTPNCTQAGRKVFAALARARAPLSAAPTRLRPC